MSAPLLTEELLRQKHDFAEALIETAQTIVLVLDTQGRIVRFNPYMESVSGYALSEVRGKDWFLTFLPATTAEKSRSLFIEAIDDIQTCGNVDAIVIRDGQERLIEWYDKTLKDDAGKTIGLLAIGQDVTERKKMEDALRKSERLLKQSQEISKAGGWEYEVASKRLYWTEEVYRIHEVGPEFDPNDVAQNVSFYAPGDQAVIASAFWQAVEHGKPYDLELRFIGAKGTPKWIRTYGRAEYDSGKIIRVLGDIQDITERKQTEETIRQLNQSLEQRIRLEVAKNREKDLLLIQQSRLATMGEMLHSIAHHWRQPLNALAVLQANIKDAFEYGELTRDSMEKYFEDGRRYIEKMSKTIDDFRDFFHTSEKATCFNLVESVRDALSLMDASLANEKIAIAVETPVDVFVVGMFNELSHILLNVLLNARDAIKSQETTGGMILIWLEIEDGMGVIRIRDNGGGIPEEILPKIFDPYFTTRSSGTGIGLYMARLVLEHMQGRIEAHNVENGAEIAVFVPAQTC